MSHVADLRVAGALDAPEVLVPLARSGDHTAFARIVRLHRTGMIRVAWVVTLDPRLAREAVAAAWPLASKRLDRLGDPARLGPWLCGIAAAEARSVAVRGPVAPGPRSATGDGHPSDSDPVSADPGLARFLGQLSADERLLLALWHLAGSTPAEIGRATGLSAAAVMARLADLEARFADRADDGFAERLRAFAAIRIWHVDIDAEARRAIVTRNDRRIQLVSLAIAVVVAVVVVSIPYVLGTNDVPLPGATGPPAPSAIPEEATATPGP